MALHPTHPEWAAVYRHQSQPSELAKKHHTCAATYPCGGKSTQVIVSSIPSIPFGDLEMALDSPLRSVRCRISWIFHIAALRSSWLRTVVWTEGPRSHSVVLQDSPRHDGGKLRHAAWGFWAGSRRLWQQKLCVSKVMRILSLTPKKERYTLKWIDSNTKTKAYGLIWESV